MFSSVLYLLVATLALGLLSGTGAIDPIKFDGEYTRQAGSDSCPGRIRFDSLEREVPANRVSVDGEECSGASFEFQSQDDVAQNEPLTNYLDREFDDDEADFVTGATTGNVTCDSFTETDNTRFTFFILEDNTPAWQWSDVYDEDVPIGEGNRNNFDPDDDASYLVTGNGDCLYRLDADDRGEEAADDAEEALTGDDDDDVCFPASATVTLESGRTVRMDQINIGDRVQVGKDLYSDVFMFTHYDAEYTSSKYVHLQTIDKLRITLTPTHYIYANNELVPASQVRVGDYLMTSDGTTSVVTEARHNVPEKGLYNPQTLHGDIIVDGIIVSTFTQAVEPKIAHALLSPLRMIYNLLSRGFGAPFKTEL